MDDLARIWVQYKVSRDFDFELPKFDAQVNNPPLGQLRMYKYFKQVWDFLFFHLFLIFLGSIASPCVPLL